MSSEAVVLPNIAKFEKFLECAKGTNEEIEDFLSEEKGDIFKALNNMMRTMLDINSSIERLQSIIPMTRLLCILDVELEFVKFEQYYRIAVINNIHKPDFSRVESKFPYVNKIFKKEQGYFDLFPLFREVLQLSKDDFSDAKAKTTFARFKFHFIEWRTHKKLYSKIYRIGWLALCGKMGPSVISRGVIDDKTFSYTTKTLNT